MYVKEGRILVSKQYSARCATCNFTSYYEYHDNMPEAIRSFRLAGWRKTKVGWQCEDCHGMRLRSVYSTNGR